MSRQRNPDSFSLSHMFRWRGANHSCINERSAFIYLYYKTRVLVCSVFLFFGSMFCYTLGRGVMDGWTGMERWQMVGRRREENSLG